MKIAAIILALLLALPVCGQDITLRLTHDATGPVLAGEMVTYTLTAEFNDDYQVLSSVNLQIIPTKPYLVSLGMGSAVQRISGPLSGWESNGAGGIDQYFFGNTLFMEIGGGNAANRDNPIVLGSFQITPSCGTGILNFIIRPADDNRPFITLDQSIFNQSEFGPSDVEVIVQPLEIGTSPTSDQLLALVPAEFAPVTDPGSDPALTRRLYGGDFTTRGELMVWGEFDSIEGIPTNWMARWDGTAWASASDGLPATGISILKKLKNGPLIAAGKIAGGVWAWGGNSWYTLGPRNTGETGPQINGEINDVIQLSDGSIVAVGRDLGELGQLGSVIIKSDGEWSTLGSRIRHQVDHVVQLPDGRIVIVWRSDSFIVIGDSIAFLDGDEWIEFGPPGDKRYHDITIDKNGDLITASAHLSSFRPSLWRYDGSGWTDLAIRFDSPVYKILALPSGDVFVSGSFSKVNGFPSRSLVQIRGDEVIATPFAYKRYSVDLVLDPFGEMLLIGSSHQYAVSSPTSGIFRIASGVDACCLIIDFVPDAIIDNADIIEFIHLFLSADPRADINRDGFFGHGDLAEFVNRYVGGCV